MSRAHAVAPSPGADTRYRGPERNGRAIAPGSPRRAQRQPSTSYIERAMLLWPRLDRTRLRKAGDDPSRIAELVVRRTSQPFEVILAMLTRQANPPSSPTEETSGFQPAELPRVALRIVRDEEVVEPSSDFVLV